MRVVASLLFVSAFFLPALRADEAKPDAHAAHGTPKIDGVVDDIWEQAKPINVSKPAISETELAEDQMATATAQLLWDKEHIYALWKVSDSKLSATADEDWAQDSVELFIDERGRMEACRSAIPKPRVSV